MVRNHFKTNFIIGKVGFIFHFDVFNAPKMKLRFNVEDVLNQSQVG